MEEKPATKQVETELEQAAAQRAKIKARAARWDLDVAVFLFLVLIIVIILLFQDIGVEVVAPLAAFGLSMVWLVGWQRGKVLYQRFYEEEMFRLEQEKRATAEENTDIEDKIEATIEDIVQRALRKRWH
jgi:hypothetical protein